MKILFVSETYYPHINGVYHFVRRLASLLQEKGHQVAVMVPSDGAGTHKHRIDDIDVYGIPSLPVVYYPDVRIPFPVNLAARVKGVIDLFEPDIIHIQNHFSLNKAAVKVARKLGIPVIGTNHFMTENFTDFFRSSAVKRAVEHIMWSEFSKVYNQLMLVTAPTETAASFIRDKLQVKVVAVSNGIDLSAFNPKGDTDFLRRKYGISDKPVLLSVGRLDPEKHLEEVLHGVAAALSRTDFQLVVVGKGVRKAALERLAQELGITDSVIFTGYVPDEDLPYFYKMGSCFITASIAELQSIATMEAMASGLPVLAVDAGALSELAREGENGYLFEPGDIGAIAACIYRLLSQTDGGRQMGAKSLELIQTHNIHQSVLVYEKIYRTYTGERSALLMTEPA